VQEPADRLGRVHHLPGRVEPAQVDVQLPVGELVDDLVRPVHGQSGLADPGGTGDGRDHHGAALRRGFVQQAAECFQLVGASGEVSYRHGKLVWHRRGRGVAVGCPGGGVGKVQGRIGAQDLPVELLQRRAGVGAQLVGQPQAYLMVVGQRLARPAAAVQGQHQLPGQAFVQRAGCGGGGQLGKQLSVPPQPQRPVVAVQFGGQPLLVGRGPHRVEPRSVQAGQGLAAPQPESLLDQPHRGLVVCGGAGLGQQPAEPVQVHRHRLHREHVAGWAPDDVDRVGGHRQRPPQPRNIRVERIARPLRNLPGPHPVDEFVQRYRPVGVNQQHGQHT
jgi:hypothetical protein